MMQLCDVENGQIEMAKPVNQWASVDPILVKHDDIIVFVNICRCNDIITICACKGYYHGHDTIIIRVWSISTPDSRTPVLVKCIKLF